MQCCYVLLSLVTLPRVEGYKFLLAYKNHILVLEITYGCPLQCSLPCPLTYHLSLKNNAKAKGNNMTGKRRCLLRTNIWNCIHYPEYII